METGFLSRFTPSLMPPDALEAIFVQREDLLREILDSIRKSAENPEKKNILLIGPRGIGKTHLISLTYYRLQAAKSIQDKVLIAWLREEEWGIACFRDLLLRIIRSLIPEDDGRLRLIYSLQPADAEKEALSLLLQLVGSRTLVILMENLDDLVRKLGNVDEMRFYQFLQKSRCCLVATSPGPSSRVFPAGSPFRKDFFQIHRLDELSFGDATQLISRIAEYQRNTELDSLIRTPRGRARVRALRYLAGGNHRAYVIFAPLLTVESIDKLVRPLMETIDQLTPYYNARIGALPWEQRQILEFICDVRYPVRAGDISRACFLPRAAASSQLDSLCALGHLRSLQTGENIYYELREPLMRLSFEVKKHRGKPIGLLLDFLRMWYSPAELKQKFSAQPVREPGLAYLPPLEALQKGWEDPRISECCREYGIAAREENYERALRAAEELVDIRGSKQDSIAQAACLLGLGRQEHSLSVFEKLINLGQEDALIWRLRGSVLNKMGRREDALSSCRRSLELDSESVETWIFEASLLLTLGRPEEALYSCETALKLNDRDPNAWMTLGMALADLDLFEESFRAFSILVEMDPQNVKARIRLCAALIELKRWNEAWEQAQHAVHAGHDDPDAWVLLGSVLAGMGKNQDALAAFNKAVSFGDGSSYVQFKLIELLLTMECWRDGAAQLDRVLEKYAISDDPIDGDTKSLIRCLLRNPLDPAILKTSIKVLVLIYRKHRMLGAMGHALIESIPDVISSTNLTDADVLLWRDCWQAAVEHLPQFVVPLRLLDSAARYRDTRDPNIFMKLSQEERTLLEALIRINVEAIA